ncbi:Alkaline-phosphatase-like, core domain [Phytophthora cactorum]|nr:Alkaline-phosphatase-like, core domain [Phytophthora cactorum]
MYGSPQDYTTGFKTAALGLGLMEDFVCATYFACTLWAFDASKRRVIEHGYWRCWECCYVCGIVAAFVAVMAPFVADLMLVANRNMRFTFELVAAVLRERHHLNAAPISAEEIQRGYEAAAVLVIVAAAFGFVRTSASSTDLSSWNPTRLVAEYLGPRTRSAVGGAKYVELTLEDGTKEARVLQIAVVFVGLVVFPAAVVALCSACSPLAAYSGLNATLNEMFGHALQPTPTDALLTGMYIHPTEQHELFGNDTLYRRTTGFQGSLAFDVDVSIDNPPNVLVIGIESFRFQDSRYLVGEEDPSNLFKGTNLTITPNFDKWATRGVALRNIWSSNPTSRSLESLLFAQVPYDSTTKTGITGGRNDTKLAGLPQLFDAKGYETFFTTGSSITLDNWNLFLPTHGYKEVWEAMAMLTLGEKHLKLDVTNAGKFMDRMEKEGILNDTIVVIMGDHGQAPEAEIMNTHEESVTRVAGTIIAEGRLENMQVLSSMMLLNRRFVQNGVGRSLKRKRTMESTQSSATTEPQNGYCARHQRLRYDRVTDAMLLHDTERDYAMTTDLFPHLSPEKQAEWKALRDNGRRITAYYKKRC